MIAFLFGLKNELGYPNDNRAIPPMIRDIETALVARVLRSIDSSSKRKGGTL